MIIIMLPGRHRAPMPRRTGRADGFEISSMVCREYSLGKVLKDGLRFLLESRITRMGAGLKARPTRAAAGERRLAAATLLGRAVPQF
jgi:hypothetical protein